MMLVVARALLVAVAWMKANSAIKIYLQDTMVHKRKEKVGSNRSNTANPIRAERLSFNFQRRLISARRQ
jgi:hypothetical protein